MAEHPGPRPLGQLLPDKPEPGAVPEDGMRARSRWTSTFVAGLELAKQGDVALEQDVAFGPIQVSLPLVAPSA